MLLRLGQAVGGCPGASSQGTASISKAAAQAVRLFTGECFWQPSAAAGLALETQSYS